MSDCPGLTLKEALLQLTDANIGHALRRAIELERERRPYDSSMRGAILHPVPAWLHADSNSPSRVKRLEKYVGRASGTAAVSAQLRQLERHRRKNLSDKLLAGEFNITGIVYPRRLDSKRVRIPNEYVGFLKPDFRRSRLHGDGLEFLDVRIDIPDVPGTIVESETVVAPDDAAAKTVIVENLDKSEIKVPIRRRPGRPGLPPEFRQEMIRRAEAGKLYEHFSDEAKYLYEWGVRSGLRNSHGDPWPRKTIENKLRALYRELKAQNRAPK